MSEIAEHELASLLSKSKDAILEYISAHPEVIYKGVPVVAILYILYPFIFTFWTWLPWIWASYQTYRIIPKGSLAFLMNLFKDSSWLLDYAKQTLG